MRFITRNVVAKKFIKKNEKINISDLVLKRTGDKNFIRQIEKCVGKRAKVNIKKNQSINDKKIKMKKKLVAAIAAATLGQDYLGKPFQNLDIKNNVKIIDNIIACLKKFKFLDEIILGISNGLVNGSFIEYAKSKKIKYILGDEKDVLSRLIQCGVKTNATDILRVSSESPFFVP